MRNGLEIHELSLTDALQRFGVQWQQLLERRSFNISLGPEFVAAAAASVGLAESMRVMVAERDGELAGVMPFFSTAMTMFSIPVIVLKLAGNLISYHHEIVAEDDCQLLLLRACLQDETRRWDVFCGEGLTQYGATANAIRQLEDEIRGTLVTYPGDAAPYLPIAQSWGEFMAARSRNFRYNLKRKEKALRGGGEIEERWFASADDADELLRCMQAIESTSWKANASVDWTSRPNELRYYETIVPFLAKTASLFANVIYVDKRPTAYHLCYSFMGRIGNMKTSFVEGQQTLSPGAVVIQHAIQRAFEIGATEFDFLGDAQYHKSLWTKEIRHHETLFLFSRRLRARAIGLGKRLLQKWRPIDFHHVVRRAEATDEEG